MSGPNPPYPSELLLIISQQIGALYENYKLAFTGAYVYLIYAPDYSIVESYSIKHDIDLIKIMSDVLTHDKILKEKS